MSDIPLNRGHTDIYNDGTISCDGEPIKLPADTLAILNEFYQEQNENLRKEEQGDIGEDWVKYCSVNNIILSNTR
jgi:hypothetical protein